MDGIKNEIQLELAPAREILSVQQHNEKQNKNKNYYSINSIIGVPICERIEIYIQKSYKHTKQLTLCLHKNIGRLCRNVIFISFDRKYFMWYRITNRMYTCRWLYKRVCMCIYIWIYMCFSWLVLILSIIVRF